MVLNLHRQSLDNANVAHFCGNRAMKNKKYNNISVIFKNIADMISDINNKIGDASSADRYIGKFHVTLENVCAAVCFMISLVFLLIAIFGAWKYFFVMGISLSVGIMIYGEAPEDAPKRRRRINR